jgi:hypothetical protein
VPDRGAPGVGHSAGRAPWRINDLCLTHCAAGVATGPGWSSSAPGSP